ncbi:MULTISPECIES: hypothetical protein [unclassified Microbacterium]|uniref:hypothetical protein n=1 Tax=unclassified Microbacterium TaxID=2609290 RepID=UPI002882DDD5|nr:MULTISPECIES: hypothetical protein [unclassified Microbacterium]
MAKHITVKGVRLQVTNDIDESNPEHMEALEGWAEYLASRAPRIAEDQAERQDASRERIHARNERLRGVTA